MIILSIREKSKHQTEYQNMEPSEIKKIKKKP
jgi:hypothetical protein